MRGPSGRAALAVALVALVSGLVSGGAPATGAASAPSLEHRQWGLDQVRARDAWRATRGEGAVVAVIDGGVDRAHPEFAGRIAGGTTMNGCGQDLTGCGDGDARSNDDGESDHGTHVAGIILAADDGAGTTGVAPRARLLTAKVMTSDPVTGGRGSLSDAARAIRWAVANGADVINLSIGNPAAWVFPATGIGSTVLTEAVAEAVDAGVVLVAAAGNDTSPVCSEPAFRADILCVVATGRDERRAPYSSGGLHQSSTIVSAPGGDLDTELLDGDYCTASVVSTVLVGQEASEVCDFPPGYDSHMGTSMAAPHVAGVAALLASVGMGREQIIDRITSTARNPLTGQRGRWDPVYGYGIVDAAAALGSLVVPAPAPSPAPSPSPSPSPTPSPDPRTQVIRTAGETDPATSAAVSRLLFPDGTRTITLARVDDYADGLAAGPLAATHNGPLLLTARDHLSTAVAEEVDRLQPVRALLVGGEVALSERIADDLRARGIEVERIAGEDRFATAAAVAAELVPTQRVYVVEGVHADPRRGWPDAVSASGLAARRGEPILLTRHSALPAATAARVGPETEVVIVGGPVSVSQEVEDELRGRAASVRRLAGADRYATAVAVAREAMGAGADTRKVFVATGASFATGLVAGAATGVASGTFLLVDPVDLDRSAATRDHLAASRDVELVRIVGNERDVSAQVEAELRELMR